MRIRLAISDENMEEVRKFLEEKGIVIDDEAEYVLSQPDKYIGHLTVKDMMTGDKRYVSVDDIIYIESFGHQMEVTTIDGTYQGVDRLYQLVNILNPEEFTRISKSVIISKRKVKQIKPSLSMKFILIMQDGKRLEVTRSYYSSFRDAFRI